MQNPIKLTSEATTSIPRWIMLLITLIYAFSGLFGHDPWKNDDAVGFGVMWTLAHGSFMDWILPNLQGRGVLVGPPLPYWLGAISIKYFGGIIGEVNAARLVSGCCFVLSSISIWYASYLLGRRTEVQPMQFALGGQPSPKEYGKTVADSALLIFLACVGLAQRVHEASPLLVELLGLTLLIYGVVRSYDKPWQGGIISGLGMVAVGLSGMLWTAIFLWVAAFIGFYTRSNKRLTGWLIGSITVTLIGLSVWPILWHQSGLSPEKIANAWFIWLGRDQLQASISFDSLEFLSLNFWAYTWPVWPLCFWSIYLWSTKGKSGINAAHLVIPGLLFLAEMILFLLYKDLSERDLMLLLPPMAILASFGLPFLRRGLISFIDWLSLLTFTLAGAFIWVIWFAKMTGYPKATADNVARYLPGFVAQFSFLDLFFALIVTAIWFAIVRWRTSRAPKVIWRCLIISTSGTILLWVLLMSLWLPTINYAKTYQPVAMRFLKALPKDAKCIDSTFLGDAQLASFHYFTSLNLKDDENCDYKLTHSSEEARASEILNRNQLELVWEDRRDSDRDERLRLYRVSTNP
jgi:4-amino-4-deoxy-L-arabinose transferase-like glycosyltransferase